LQKSKNAKILIFQKMSRVVFFTDPMLFVVDSVPNGFCFVRYVSLIFSE